MRCQNHSERADLGRQLLLKRHVELVGFHCRDSSRAAESTAGRQCVFLADIQTVPSFENALRCAKYEDTGQHTIQIFFITELYNDP